MSDRQVVLGVSGGIAAYKACELLRLLTESGERVRVVPTPDALRFVGVEFIDKPASAEKVWRVVQEAQGQVPADRAPEGGGTGAASMTPEEEGGVA